MSVNDRDPPGDDPPEPYKVGYKRPPLATRFGPGNRAAARRRQPPLARDILIKVLDENVSATRGGKPVKMSAREGMYRKFRQQALSGDVRSFRELMKEEVRHKVSSIIGEDPHPQDVDHVAEFRAKIELMTRRRKENEALLSHREKASGEVVDDDKTHK